MKCDKLEFSKEVQEQLKYYVYRLVDPRNGKTFYIGKGSGNRVFGHVHDALKGDFSEEKAESDKIKTIREISACGLKVIHIIQRYGLDEHEAFIAESVLIDAYSLENLSNEISGQDSFEPTNAEVLMKELALPEFGKDVPPFMIIKVKDSTVAANNGDRYAATRQSWKINPENAKGRYVLSVTNGVVKEVYEVDEWIKSVDNPGRYEFIGKPADEEVAKRFKGERGQRVPAEYVKQGSSNPVQYGK